MSPHLQTSPLWQSRGPQISFLLALVAMSTGCATVQTSSSQPVPHLLLSTKGAAIEGQNWRIEPGKPVTPPFRSDRVLAIKPAKYGPLLSAGRIQRAMAGGAQAVRVHYPGLEQPLYGVLWLGAVSLYTTGSAARVYSIQIPQQRVDDASGGRVSCVYQPFNVGNQTHASWALWLSDLPFPVDPRRARMDAIDAERAAQRGATSPLGAEGTRH